MTELEHHVVPDELDGERIDKALAVLAGLSRSAARQLIDEGNVMVNGGTEKASARIAAGDRLAFRRLPEQDRVEPNPAVRFEVLYEDDHLAVLDKPPHLVVHPGIGHGQDTLVSGLLARWPRIEGVGQAGRWGVVHRLDRDTSGVLVVALTQAAYERLVEMLAGRRVRRIYRCLVHGTFDVARGTIDAPIGRDPVAPMRMAVDREGKPARTHYRRRRTFPDLGMSLLDVELETGRTHQIRVHLASIGHPVVGDAAYRRFPPTIDLPRMFLHASRIEFQHPLRNEKIEVTASLPADLAEVLDRLS